MLRINLLPAYIAERRRTRTAIAGMSLAFAAATALILTYYFVTLGSVTALEEQADAEEQAAQQVTQIQSEAQTIRAGVQPITAKRDFVDGVLFYNTLRPKIFRNVAAYTFKNVEYNQMAVAGQTLNISAFARSVSDVGRFLITMYGNPDLEAVSISGVPGWPPGNTAGGGGGGSFPGAPGGGGFPGGRPGGGFPSGGGGFPGGGPPGFPGGGGGIPGGFPGGGSGFPGGGMAGRPGGGGFGNQQQARQGFPFTVVGRLVQPVVPPTPPTGAPAGGAGGGFGGGGSPGGYPGAPGGGGFSGPPGGYPGAPGGGYPGAPSGGFSGAPGGPTPPPGAPPGVGGAAGRRGAGT